VSCPEFVLEVNIFTIHREAQKNDRTLFKLIHTKLLSASLDEHSDMNGAKRKKSLEGRVLELATAAKLGKGETTIRKQEHSKAPKHIREGIASKRRERNQTKLEDVSWSPILFDSVLKILLLGKGFGKLSSHYQAASCRS
jgi:hypothetical protein